MPAHLYTIRTTFVIMSTNSNDHSKQIYSLLSNKRFSEAEFLIRNAGSNSIADLHSLQKVLNTSLDPAEFYVSPGYYGPFPSWHTAATLCGRGYQKDSVCTAYFSRYQQLTSNIIHFPDPSSSRLLTTLLYLWSIEGRPNELTILDIGGGLGFHALPLKRIWNLCKINWIIYETPMVFNLASSLHWNSDDDAVIISFCRSLNLALLKQYDLSIASASLQYFEKWELIAELLCLSRWLFLDRLPLAQSNDHVVNIQVTPSSYTDTKYPGWIFSESKFMNYLSKHVESIVAQWPVYQDSWNLFDPYSGHIVMSSSHEYGLLARTKCHHICATY